MNNDRMTIQEEKRSRYVGRFLDYAEGIFSSIQTKSPLAESMKYSFFAGGKRIRPALMLAVTDMLGGDTEEVLPFAFALECIHTSSLIHDDLPALDNDTLRRGKPTNHVAFGEANAVLAGDALMNLAYETGLSACDNEKKVRCMKLLADHTGYGGMLGGQGEDVEWEKSKKNGTADESVLLEIDSLKTGKLLTVPFAIPAILYAEDSLPIFLKIGSLFGRIFQFADDVADVTSSSSKLGKSVGKDEKEGKLTAVSVYGIDGAKARIRKDSEELQNLIKSLDNSDILEYFLKGITEGI